MQFFLVFWVFRSSSEQRMRGFSLSLLGGYVDRCPRSESPSLLCRSSLLISHNTKITTYALLIRYNSVSISSVPDEQIHDHHFTPYGRLTGGEGESDHAINRVKSTGRSTREPLFHHTNPYQSSSKTPHSKRKSGSPSKLSLQTTLASCQ